VVWAARYVDNQSRFAEARDLESKLAGLSPADHEQRHEIYEQFARRRRVCRARCATKSGRNARAARECPRQAHPRGTGDASGRASGRVGQGIDKILARQKEYEAWKKKQADDQAAKGNSGSSGQSSQAGSGGGRRGGGGRTRRGSLRSPQSLAFIHAGYHAGRTQHLPAVGTFITAEIRPARRSAESRCRHTADTAAVRQPAAPDRVRRTSL